MADSDNWDPRIVEVAFKAYLDGVDEGLRELEASKLLAAKNPLLYLSRGIGAIDQLVSQIVDDWLTSSEETKFGKYFFEALAKQAPFADTSDAPGLDIVIRRSGESPRFYAIKAGPNTFNGPSESRQKAQIAALLSLKRELKSAAPEAIVGHAMGRKGGRVGAARRVSGEALWEELFGVGFLDWLREETKAVAARMALSTRREQILATAKLRLLKDFETLVGDGGGGIDYDQWLEFNSGKSPRPRRRRSK